MVRIAHNRYTHIKNEDIVRKYQEGLSSIQIADEYGVNKSFILSRLSEAGVNRRKPNACDNVTKEALLDLYVSQKLSTRSIAEILGCGKTLVNKRLALYGITRRKNAGDESFTQEERKEKWGMRLDDHPRWKGGVSAVSTLIRNRLAPISRERLYIDNYTCQSCNNPNGSMHVHHKRHFSDIVADILKENPHINLLNEVDRLTFVELCENDARLLDIDNLVTLCSSCHDNEHAEVYIAPVMWEALEERWREYVRENHFTMSIKELRGEVRAQNTRIVEFMESENLKYAYDNPEWLAEQIKTKNFTTIASEFTTKTKKVTSQFIKAKANQFGLINKDNTKMVKLYNEGWSLLRISTELGVSKPTIRKRLLDEGIDTSVRAFRKDVKFEEIVDMITNGYTLHRIAEEKNCSVCKVQDLLKSHGTSITNIKRASSN